MMLENPRSERSFSRRSILKTASTVVRLAIASQVPGVVNPRSTEAYSAPVTVESNKLLNIPDNAQPINRIPWSSGRWAPFSEQVANKYGIKTLYSVGGALELHDVIKEMITGERGGAQNAEYAWTQRIINPSPDDPDHDELIAQAPRWRQSGGHCHALAVAGFWEYEPRDGEIVIHGAKYRVSKAMKIDLLLAKHSAPASLLVPNETIPALANNGKPLVVLTQPGDWFRAGYGYSGGRLTVTNFAQPALRIALSEAKGQWLLYDRYSGLQFEENMLAETASWINPEVDPQLIDHLVAS